MTPHNVDREAELAVLSSWLFDTKVLDKLVTCCRAEDFYFPLHRAVWATLTTLHRDNQAIDTTAVARGVSAAKGQQAGADCIALLLELSDHPAIADAEPHARRVHDCAEARRLVAELEKATALARAGSTGDAIAAVRQEIDRDHDLGVKVLSERDVLQEGYNAIRNWKRNRVAITGFSRVDDITGGIQGGHTWVVGAESNWGKTAWLEAVAHTNLCLGIPSLIVELEDAPPILGKRLMSRVANVPIRLFRGNRLSREDHIALTTALEAGRTTPFLVDGRGKYIEDLCPAVEQLIRQYGIKLVIWDYVQDARTRKDYGVDLRKKVMDTAAAMRRVTQQFDIGGIIMSQITQQAGKQYPDKDSIRECRDICHAAEVVALGFRLKEETEIEVDNQKQQYPEGQPIFFIDKDKDGEPKRRVPIHWDPDHVTFRDPNPLPDFDELDPMAEDYDARWP